MSYVWGCTGKVPYATQNEAYQVIRWMSKHGKGHPKRVYICANGHWHLTSLSKSEMKRRLK